MSDHDDTTIERVPREEPDPNERPKIRVTDRRRSHGEVAAAREGAARLPATDGGALDVQAELEETRRKAGEYLDHLQRLKAEFDNFRKRELKERTRAIEMAGEPLVRRLLEVLDEFDLALMAAEKKPEFEKFLHGVELVYAKLLDILRAEGVERIDAKGKAFDPTLHEALMESAEGDGAGDAEPVVADILRQGYTLRGRVVRPAGVKVTRR
jgi:molecular chaperone GrpE